MRKNDKATGQDGAAVRQLVTVEERPVWQPSWGITRFKNQAQAEAYNAAQTSYAREEATRLIGQGVDLDKAVLLARRAAHDFFCAENLVENVDGVPELQALILPKDDALELFGGVQQLSVVPGNVLLNEGINEAWTILASASSGTKFDSANAYLGVGDDATGESASHTDLQAATNKLYVAMMASYPTYGTSQKATWRSEYTSAQANWAWNEFTVANGSSGASENLNRKVSSQGTKASGQTWQLTLEITLS